MRRAALPAALLALLATGSALASVPGGKWTGHYGKDTTAKVKFTVKKGAIHNFSSFVPAYCISTGQYEFDTFLVPKAKIKNGKAHTTYKVKQNGETIGRLHLTAVFSGSHATGTLSGSYTGCTIAKYTWTADH